MNQNILKSNIKIIALAIIIIFLVSSSIVVYSILNNESKPTVVQKISKVAEKTYSKNIVLESQSINTPTEIPLDLSNITIIPTSRLLTQNNITPTVKMSVTPTIRVSTPSASPSPTDILVARVTSQLTQPMSSPTSIISSPTRVQSLPSAGNFKYPAIILGAAGLIVLVSLIF